MYLVKKLSISLLVVYCCWFTSGLSDIDNTCSRETLGKLPKSERHYDEWKFAHDIALNAGEIIKEAFYKDKDCTKECSITDVVKRVQEYVTSLDSVHKIVDEKCITTGECTFDRDYTWIISHVVGTTNFVHRFPYVGISIALYDNSEPLIAMVYNPIINEMYTARPGKGAFLNCKPIHVSNVADLKSSLVLSEFGDEDMETRALGKIIDNKRKVRESCHGMRSVGSAALSMCLVAQGSADAYFEQRTHYWDVAAGALIVKEAGGVLNDYDGNNFDLMSRRVLCANIQNVADEIAPLLDKIQADRDDSPQAFTIE